MYEQLKDERDDSRIDPNRTARVDQWIEVYTEKLKMAAEKHPDIYSFLPSQAAEVASRMRKAFIHGSYNHDSYAIRWTCQHFKIKHTRKAIEAWFNQVPSE